MHIRFYSMTLMLQRARKSTCGKQSHCTARLATSRTRSCSTQPSSSRTSSFAPGDRLCASRRLRPVEHEHLHRAGPDRTGTDALFPHDAGRSSPAEELDASKDGCVRRVLERVANAHKLLATVLLAAGAATRRSTTCLKYVLRLCGDYGCISTKLVLLLPKQCLLIEEIIFDKNHKNYKSIVGVPKIGTLRASLLIIQCQHQTCTL